MRGVGGVLLAALVVVLAGWLLVPASVSAQVVPAPDPGGLLPDLPSPADLLPSVNPADWAVGGFKAILGWMFGDVEDLGRNLVRVLLDVPLLADRQDFRRLNKLRDYVLIIAVVLLALSLVVATLQGTWSNWVGGGAIDAVEGLKRTVIAVFLLVGFPVAFDQTERLVNALTSALIVNPVVGSGLADGAGPFAAFVAAGSLVTGGGLAMFVAVSLIVFALFLLVVKVTITALLAVLWVSSPLAIALWPIEELSALWKALLAAILGALAFPVVWALCFAVFATLSPDALFASDSGDLIQTLLAPLTSLAMVIIAFLLPFAVMRRLMQAGMMPKPAQAVRNVMLARRLAGAP
jgi:hypothetical protein